MSVPSPRAPAGALCMLAAVAALAVGLRFVGLGHLLPHHPEPDAQLVDIAGMYRTGLFRRDFVYSTYPHLLPRVLALAPVPAPDGPVDAEHLDLHLAAARAPYVHGRALSAALSALLVPLTYWIARRFLSPWAAVLAAAFVATSLLHVMLAPQARPHAPFAAFAAWTVLAALRLRERPDLQRHGEFGLALGAAIGTLHSAAFLLPLGPLALVLRDGGARRAVWRRALLPLAIAGGAGVLTWPFLFERAPAGEWTEGESFRFPHRLDAEWWDATGFARNLDYAWGHDPVLLGLAALGLAWVVREVRRRRPPPAVLRSAALAAAFALPYGAAIGLFGRTYPRLLLPLVPFAALLAAAPFERLAVLLAAHRAARLPAALALLALALPTYAAARFAWLRSRPDTLELEAHALLADAGLPAAVVACHGALVLPLPFRLAERAADVVRRFPQPFPWLVYLDRLAAAGRPADGPLLELLIEDQGFLRLSEEPTPEERARLADWLSGFAADHYFVGTMDLPAFTDAIEEALVAVCGAAALHPEPEPRLRHARSFGYQEDHLLAAVLGRGTWGPSAWVGHRARPGTR